jgi:hypothetical protein
LPGEITPVPFVNTPVRVTVAPLVIVMGVATKLVMDGAEGGLANEELPPLPPPLQAIREQAMLIISIPRVLNWRLPGCMTRSPGLLPIGPGLGRVEEPIQGKQGVGQKSRLGKMVAALAVDPRGCSSLEEIDPMREAKATRTAKPFSV